MHDVIVIGGGGAGVMAAAAAAKEGARVAIVCKEPVGYGNTRMAVGLTACAGLTGDSRENFIENMVQSGEGLSRRELVETLVDGSREALSLLEELGHTFTRNQKGELADHVISRSGGHSHARTLQSSGAGIGIGQVLRSAVAKYGITLLEDTLALELVKQDDIVCGVRLLDLATSEEYTLDTQAVVLATGGAGWLFYPQTSNNRGSTGDGYVLACHAGAELMDMEQVQALPFGITHPQAYRGLVCGEPVVAGPAGKIVDGDGSNVLDGGIFKMGRAAVVRAMAEPIKAGRVTKHGGLLLDLSPNLAGPDGTVFRDRVRSSGITDTVLTAYGRKAFDWEEPWDVLPTVHFMMGGVIADRDGDTTVPGLYVAGEVMGGVHGGNRLGSTALTEILVYGLRAGRAAALSAKKKPARTTVSTKRESSRKVGSKGKNRPAHLSRRLQEIMWKQAGFVKNRRELLSAIDTVSALQKEAEDLNVCNETVYNLELLDAVELHVMLETAKLILTSALLREESRGAHLREDFPKDGGFPWQKNIIIRRSANGQLQHRIAGWKS
ncbi:MAG: FAD-dependent oxidoreductase [Bacillota bacterium]|nr:FAD-dependent oxidoreductase [Bacillota bacterium]MDW7684944.1 FAD-dependent oxidoreductase [Bacillota bacterium]